MLKIFKTKIKSLVQPPLHKPNIGKTYWFLGTEYGGWPLLSDTADGALIYSFGVGEDISFDLEAITRFHCNVHAFDPTPKSKSWVAAQVLPENFHFHPEGVASKDGEATFAPPKSEQHVSFSCTDATGSSSPHSITAPVKRIRTFIDELGACPAIIKMDVEGFEYDVIDDMLESAILPQQLLIEFHHGLYGFRANHTRRAVAALIAVGYGIFFVSSSGREYAFCLRL